MQLMNVISISHYNAVALISY